MMTRATDARSKAVFKIVQAKNSVFTNGLLANGLRPEKPLIFNL
jgi:hypothetical protein